MVVMRRLVLLGCVLLAGCDDAVVLEVHTAPGVATETVQLYIGLGVCSDCPGIQPPQTPEILPGVVMFREAANQRVREAKVENGVATFRIEASDSFDRFDLAIAVDANGQSAAVIQNLPLDTAGRYRVDLLPSSGKLGIKPATANGNFVAIWRQPAGMQQCMGFERWEGGDLVGERVFIVPENDLDCDGRAANECAPFGFDALGVPPIADSTCTTLAPLALDVDVCKLGGPTCDEATGTPHPCAPTEYCLPSYYCDVTNLACTVPQDRDRCLFTTDPANAMLHCTIGFQPSSDQTHADSCGNSLFAKFNLLQNAGTTNPTTCVGPEKDFLLEPRAGVLAFQETVKHTSRDTANKEWTLETRIHWEGDCNYKLEAQGEKAVGVTKPDPKPTFAQFWVAKNGGARRKVLVPIVIDYTNDCSMPSKCTLILEQDDSIARCLR